MAWKGNATNPVPNFVQKSADLSEKKDSVNRAQQVKRDTDEQKNYTVRLIDVDTAILKQIERFQLNVIDNGNRIKVPTTYASPEKWKSIQKDGFMRDYNGKIILPAIVFNRTTSDKDPAMMSFNRYLKYPVMKLYSSKNKYTPFNVLMGQNAPINEIFDVVVPDHMIFTYHFIIWTEYVEQMNTLVERMNFETDDYWGDSKGYRFRTNIESFSHAIELQVEQDRLVKTEFDLVVHGYLLPDTNYGLDGSKSTTQKSLTPKKIIMGTEVVPTDFDLSTLDKNMEKWRNVNYPNIQKDVVIPPAPMVFSDDISTSVASEVIDSLKEISTRIDNEGVGNLSANLRMVQPPASPNAPGESGTVAFDNQYFYIYSNNGWRRVAISQFIR